MDKFTYFHKNYSNVFDKTFVKNRPKGPLRFGIQPFLQKSVKNTDVCKLQRPIHYTFLFLSKSQQTCCIFVQHVGQCPRNEFEIIYHFPQKLYSYKYTTPINLIIFAFNIGFSVPLRLKTINGYKKLTKFGGFEFKFEG